MTREELTPRLVAGLDPRSLSIGPEEAFVLSRVDGRSTGAQIALATGLDALTVGRALDRLVAVGAITFAVGQPDGGTGATGGLAYRPTQPAMRAIRSGSERPDPASTRVRLEAPVVETLGRQPEPAPPAQKPLYDPAELDEPIDLDRERKQLILEMFYRLDELDHYALLKVDPTADKKVVKRAYFDLVSRFHPDKYFGKQLGSYAKKLETLFQRLTLAHDTLTKDGARADYEKYLESRRATRALDRLSDDRLRASELAALRQQMEAEALAESAERPSVTPPASLPSEPPGRPSPTPQRISQVELSVEDRRRALARKFLGGRARPDTQRPPAPVSAENRRRAAADELKRRYESRLSRIHAERVRRFVQQAKDAEAANNLVGAVNALRIARELSPDDPDIASHFDRVDQKANVMLSEKYLEQGKYEEQSGQFLEAARSYERVLRGRPSAPVYERAAECYLQAGGDLRRAAEAAKKAVEMAPEDAGYRLTLAKVYVQAGMSQSALSELERAKTLEPGNDTIKDWIRRIKRGES